MEMTFVLFALLTLQAAASPDWQKTDEDKSGKSLSLLDKLQSLRSETPDKQQTELKSVSETNIAPSSDIKTIMHSRLKRNKHKPSRLSSRRGHGCALATCQSQNLAYWLHLLKKNQDKEARPPKDPRDPTSYGRKRRSLHRDHRLEDNANAGRRGSGLSLG